MSAPRLTWTPLLVLPLWPPIWYMAPKRTGCHCPVYLIELSRRRSSVAPPPAVVPEKPMSEKACAAPIGSYLPTPSASSVTWRPKVRVPRLLELRPAYAAPAKSCPATLESTLVVCWLSGRPLLSVMDLSPSERLPDWGLKKVSRRKTADRSPPRGSIPESPRRDCERFEGVIAVIEPLEFLEMIASVPAGK